MRAGGYAAIRDYAAIGDGRAVALVARDGAIDWLSMPDLDSPSLFAALLDAERGGSFELRPSEPYRVERQYRPGTNVLETTFHTRGGVVRLVDVMTLAGPGLTPFRELARRVEGLAGHVSLSWRIEPRFGYAEAKTGIERRLGIPVATSAASALAVQYWGADESTTGQGAIGGEIELRARESALIALSMCDKSRSSSHHAGGWRPASRPPPARGPTGRQAAVTAAPGASPSSAARSRSSCSSTRHRERPPRPRRPRCPRTSVGSVTGTSVPRSARSRAGRRPRPPARPLPRRRGRARRRVPSGACSRRSRRRGP